MNSGCNVIIAAFSPRLDTSLERRVVALLPQYGLVVDRTEQAPQGLLIFAQSRDCDSLNLLHLRQQLSQSGQQLGVEFRVQREELFRAMHRITPL